MKEIKLTLSLRKVMQRIEMYSYYTGEARKKAGLPKELAAGMQASSDDSVQLYDHVSSAIGELSKMLSRFLGICSVHYEGSADDKEIYNAVFSLIPPFNYPLEAFPQIEEAMENYAVMRTLGLWLQQHKPDEVMAITTETQQHSLHLRELFALRKRPGRIVRNDDNIITL